MCSVSHWGIADQKLSAGKAMGVEEYLYTTSETGLG